MEPIRLDSLSSAVAERYRRASPSGRKRAVLLACEHAVATAGLAAHETDEALESLRGEAPANTALRQRLEALAAKFDDEYFRMEEGSDLAQKAEALRFFSKARAVSALAFAVSGDDNLLHEAIYESIAAVDDPAALTRTLSSALV